MANGESGGSKWRMGAILDQAWAYAEWRESIRGAVILRWIALSQPALRDYGSNSSCASIRMTTDSALYCTLQCSPGGPDTFVKRPLMELAVRIVNCRPAVGWKPFVVVISSVPPIVALPLTARRSDCPAAGPARSICNVPPGWAKSPRMVSVAGEGPGETAPVALRISPRIVPEPLSEPVPTSSVPPSAWMVAPGATLMAPWLEKFRVIGG